MMKPGLLTMILIVCQITGSGAQAPGGEKPPLPPGPLVQKRAPDFARWTITTKYKRSGDTGANEEEEEASQAIAKRISVTKTRDIYRTECSSGYAAKSEVWSNGQLQIAVGADGGDAEFVARPGSRSAINPLWVDYSNTDFLGFDWIAPENYSGIRNYRGREALVFVETIEVPAEASTGETDSKESAPASYSVVAYIDLQSRLPLALEDLGGMQEYRYLSVPNAMQTLPKSVQRKIADEQQKKQSLDQKPTRPF